jgi:hypothetical protein
LHAIAASATTAADYTSLEKERGIPARFFKEAGFVKWGERWMVPVCNADGGTVNLHVKDPDQPFMSSPKCFLHLFNEQALTPDAVGPFYIAEGPWDMVAMQYLLKSNRKPGTVVAVSGAGIFKREWVDLFPEDADIKFLFDNDEAGSAGMKHAIDVFSGKKSRRRLSTIQWPKKLADGYDINDFVRERKRNLKATWKALAGMLQSTAAESSSTAEGKPAEKEPQKPARKIKMISLATCHRVFKKWLHLPEPDVLDVVLAMLAANGLPDDPLWMYLIGAAGSGKTEMVSAIRGHEDVFWQNDFTASSLCSGLEGKDGKDKSLLPKLDGKVLVVPDFTTVLTTTSDSQSRLYGILRSAYDGTFDKSFSTVGERSSKSRFGIIFAVTSIIERYFDAHSILGERFLAYRMPTEEKDRRKMLEKSLDNAGFKDKMRIELADAVLGVLAGVRHYRPKLPPAIRTATMGLAELVSHGRTPVEHLHNSKLISRPHEIEFANRVVCQLLRLGLGVALLRGKRAVTWAEYKIMRRVALDSIPSDRSCMIQALSRLLIVFMDTPVVQTFPLKYRYCFSLPLTPGVPLRRSLPGQGVLKLLDPFHCIGEFNITGAGLSYTRHGVRPLLLPSRFSYTLTFLPSSLSRCW